MKKVEITTLETVIEVREKSLTLQSILPLGTPPQEVGGKKRNPHSRQRWIHQRKWIVVVFMVLQSLRRASRMD